MTIQGLIDDYDIHEPPFTGDYHYDNFQYGDSVYDALNAGDTFVDPIFGSTIKRLTDDYGANKGQDLYSHNYVSLNGKYFFHNDTSDVQHIRLMSDGSSVETGVPKGNTGQRQWSPIDQEVYYYISGSGVYSWTVGDGSGVLIHNFGSTLGDNGGSLNFVDRTARYFVVQYDAGNAVVYDSVTNTEYTGTTIPDPGYGHVSISPDADYIFWVSEGVYYAYPLDNSAHTVGAAVEFWKDGGDHCCFLTASDGNNYMLRGDGNVDGRFYIADIRDRSALSEAAMRAPSTGVYVVIDPNWRNDGHITAVWVGDNKDWFFLNKETPDDLFDDYEAGGAWGEFEQEIIAVNALNHATDSSPKIARLCHHRSRNLTGAYHPQPRVSCSPDGVAFIWASNFNHNDVAGTGYQEIWGIENPLGTTSASVSQEGFRWRADDGSESGATWLESQDTDAALLSDTNYRIRILIDGTGDPASARYRLEYKLSTDSQYLPVQANVGAVRLAASANIASGGEATTAQLTPPAGKTTGDFTVGRMWDDENGADAIDIADGNYTELEWCIQVISTERTPGDTFNFRIAKL